MGTSLASVLQKEKSIRNQTQEEFNKSTENVNSKNERGIAYNKHGFKFESKRQHSAANSGQICVSNGDQTLLGLVPSTYKYFPLF